MNFKIFRAATALALLCALLLVSAPLAADPVGGAGDPPVEAPPPDGSGGGEDPGNGTDLGPVTDPDGLSAGSPTPDGGAFSFLSWLESLLGGFVRGF